MLFDILFDRLVSHPRRFKQQRFDQFRFTRSQGDTGSQKPNTSQQNSNFFHSAHDFVVNDLTLASVDNRYQIIQHFVAGNTGVDPILERIATYANLDATMDSSARYPPPLCHPGTRLKIGDKLFNWLVGPDREWNMQWLHGPAGTGKSAVAQTFAERCNESGRLGASFFFSRLYNRNDPDTLVPTLIYQLAVRNPEYKSLVAVQLANDPELLRKKTHRAQFKKLIIEPFSLLQTRRRRSVLEPLLVVLDGLDECEGESAQREIVEMIDEVVRLKKDFPLVWLICSRPEAHLKCIFSRADFTVNCGREELPIDAESIADVDFYLRDGLAGIRANFPYLTTPMWPSEEQIKRLSKKASGHFGFASTSLRYIGDPIHAAPMAQLDTLLSFLSGVRVGTSSPLGALDALYTGILLDVPDEALPTLELVLGSIHDAYVHYGDTLSVQYLCNFLSIDQATFYKSFHKLHSVVNVPSPEAASKIRLQFYHLSFEDYIGDFRRSGKFAIEQDSALLQYSKLYLSWYKTILESPRTADGPKYTAAHRRGVFPHLSWISDGDGKEIFRSIERHVIANCWMTCSEAFWWDKALLSQIKDFDFRYIATDDLDSDWCEFVNKLWKESPDDFVRTEPQGEVDRTLLEYMGSILPLQWRSRPVSFPLDPGEDDREGEYFLLGRGTKAIVCWTTGFPKYRFSVLNYDEAPSKKQISAYRTWLVRLWR